jgi:type IV secretion system protein VirB11
MNSRDDARQRLQSQLCHELGKPILDALAQRGVSDVKIRADGILTIKRLGQWTDDSNAYYPPERRETIIGLVADSLHRVVTFDTPSVEGEFEIDGQRYRFAGLISPAVAEPIIAIRKPAEIIYTLDKYEADGIITNEQRAILTRAVIDRRNIFIAGGMGSGKSTLVNALIALIPLEHYVGIVEDTYELQCNLPRKDHLHTTESLDLRAMVRRALRLQLDRIVVGEVRGAEALELLKAWNTGSPGGVATIHADDAASALLKLDTFVQETGVPSQRELIAQAVHLVVFITQERGARKVTEILNVKGLSDSGAFILNPASCTSGA